MRPSVTMATRRPLAMRPDIGGNELVQFRHAVGARALSANDGNEVFVEPALSAAAMASWLSNTRAGAVMSQYFGSTAEVLMTDRPRLPRSSLRPPSAENGFDTGRRIFSSCDFSAASRHTSLLSTRNGSFAYADSPGPQTVIADSCARPASMSSRTTNAMPPAAWNWFTSASPFGYTRAISGVTARDVRHVVPGDREADGARHGHEVDDVVGRAAGRHEADDGVDERTLVDDFDERQVVGAERGGLRDALRGRDRERMAQRRVRRDERRAGHVQPHHLHEHLVGIGGAVERAGAGVVVRAHLGGQQFVTRGEAFGVSLAHFGLRPCWPCRSASARPARR